MIRKPLRKSNSEINLAMIEEHASEYDLSPCKMDKNALRKSARGSSTRLNTARTLMDKESIGEDLLTQIR